MRLQEPALPEASALEALLVHFQPAPGRRAGVKAETADTYVSHAWRFVAGQVPSGELRSLQARDVTAAVLSESAQVSAASVRTFEASLRAFLRFCLLEGLLDVDLSEAALAVGGGRRPSSLSRGVLSSDADALLKSCDRRTAMGRRDYAVILLLLRLGLRAGEVAALKLDDIDWRARSWSTARAANFFFFFKKNASTASSCQPMWAERSPLTLPGGGPTALAGRCSCEP